MNFITDFKHNLFNTSSENFEEKALSLFQYQGEHNPIYHDFLHYLKIVPSKIKSIENIPFLPIEFFKKHTLKTHNFTSETTFQSSGTTGNKTSIHHVKNTNFYLKNCQEIFESFYNPIEEYTVLALLPAYLERQNSSLVLMAEDFIKKSKKQHSGFYLYNFEELKNTLEICMSKNEKILLLGVTFALLDFAEQFPMKLKNTIVMETGGMKGRKKEMIREDIHIILKKAFSLDCIHSEYGMTELLSQAYSKGNGIFKCPPWFKINLREIDNPLKTNNNQRYGAINIIDLANVDSCAFLATQDLGRIDGNKFEVIGRIDNSDIRGCNLLVI